MLIIHYQILKIRKNKNSSPKYKALIFFDTCDLNSSSFYPNILFITPNLMLTLISYKTKTQAIKIIENIKL
jgi:hypothetical protein